MFRKHLPNKLACGAELSKIKVLRHKPGRRCLIEYTLKNISATGTEVLLGKVRARGLDWRTYEVRRALWRIGGRHERILSVPEPVAAIPELHLWLQRKVAGEQATGFIQGPGGPALCGRIGQAVRSLHLAGVPSQRQHTAATEMEILGIACCA